MTNAQPKRILIVEDDPTMTAFLTNTLRDYQVKAVQAVEEALLLAPTAFDLVLLDLMVGVESGLQVAEIMRKFSPYLPIVILTGHGTLESAIRAIELGVQAYLLKPINPEQLRALLAAQIERMESIRLRDELAQHMSAAVNALREATTTLTLSAGPLTLHQHQFKALYQGFPLALSPTQFRILWAIVRGQGQPVAAATIVAEALGFHVSETEAREMVKGHVSHIRKKLIAAQATQEHILTVRDVGYLWVS